MIKEHIFSTKDKKQNKQTKKSYCPWETFKGTAGILQLLFFSDIHYQVSDTWLQWTISLQVNFVFAVNKTTAWYHLLLHLKPHSCHALIKINFINWGLASVENKDSFESRNYNELLSVLFTEELTSQKKTIEEKN